MELIWRRAAWHSLDEAVEEFQKKGCESLFSALLEVLAWGNSMSSSPADPARFQEFAAQKSTGLTCSGAVDDMVVDVPGREDVTWSYDVLMTDGRGKVLILIDSRRSGSRRTGKNEQAARGIVGPASGIARDWPEAVPV